jgi:hemerythrin-like metal-binding domain
MKEYIPGGKAEGMDLQDIADKHGISLDIIEREHKMLVELAAYTQYHFTTEENEFFKHDFPEGRIHSMEHDLLEATVKTQIEAYLENDDFQLYDTLKFLKEWLTHHIMTVDKRFATFMKDKDDKASGIWADPK